MDRINKNVAMNLKRIRKEKLMSLDAVADCTGISKSMLGQIEREQSNPTIAVLGKIIVGLDVDINDLICTPPKKAFIVNKERLEPSHESSGEYIVYTYFPYERKSGIEMNSIEVFPGAKYEVETPGNGSEQYIFVEKGDLTLITEEKIYNISEQDAIRIDMEGPYQFINAGDDILRFECISTIKEHI